MTEPGWGVLILFIFGGAMAVMLAAAGKVGPWIDMRATPAAFRYSLAGVLGLVLLVGAVGMASRLLGR